MSKAIDLLNSEHTMITAASESAENLFKQIQNGEKEPSAMLPFISFFRKYADEYHHKKEEDILFPEMAKRNVIAGESVIREMFDNHEEFRDMLRAIETHINSGDIDTAYKRFKEYSEALLDHIAVEDDEVFQIAETLFSEDELETIYYRFLDADRELGDEAKKLLEGLV